MIHKIRKGKLESFKRALDYNLDKPETSIIGGNMLGTSTQELLEEFRKQQELNPDVRRSLVHAMVRLPPGEELDAVTWHYVAERYMAHLGYAHAPYVVFLEETAEHGAHIHIVASAIRDDGRRVDDSNDHYRGQEIMRELEQELGLQRVRSSDEVGITAPTVGEMHAAVRRGEAPHRRVLQRAILEAARDKPTLTELIDRLERAGVDIRPKLRRDGLLTGMTYRLPSGAVMKGTHLGRAFTARGLSKYLHVGYDPQRDRPALERARLRFDARESRDAALGYLRVAIDHQIADRPTLPELLRRLQERGIGATLNLARTGHLSGLTYMIHDHTFKASELGREYTPKGLEKRGVGYDAEHDAHPLRERMAQSLSEPEATVHRLLGLDDAPLEPEEALRQLLGIGETAAERDDLERLLAAVPHDPSRLAELPGPAGLNLSAEDLEDLYPSVGPLDHRLAELRTELLAAARALAPVAEQLGAHPSEAHLRAFEAHRAVFLRVQRDLERTLAGIVEMPEVEADRARVGRIVARPFQAAAHGEAHLRAERLRRIARAYAEAPEPRLIASFRAENRRYRQLRRKLERWRRPLDVPVAGDLSPARLRLEAGRTLHRGRAALAAERAEAAAERFARELRPDDRAAFEHAERRARWLLGVSRGEAPLQPLDKLRAAEAQGRLTEARKWLELGEQRLRNPELPLPPGVLAAEPQRADLERELFQAAREFHERSATLRERTSHPELEALDAARRRFAQLREQLGLDPEALERGRLARLQMVVVLERRLSEAGDATDAQRLLGLRRELAWVERGEPLGGWRTELGPRAIALGAEAERALALHEYRRAAGRMIQAAERSFEHPADGDAVRDFYRASGALRRARAQLERLALTPEPEALAQATQAQRFFAAMRLREAATRLGALAEQPPIDPAVADPAVADHARRGFERALGGLLRELPPVPEQQTLEAGLDEAFRQLGQAHRHFERQPSEATAAALETARQELSERFRHIDALHRRVIAEHLPQAAGAYQAGLAAQAQLALARYRALGAQVLAALESWRQLPRLEPLPAATLEPALREIERLELRWGSTIGADAAPLRAELREAQRLLATTRLAALEPARTELASLDDGTLAELGKAEERLAHTLGLGAEAERALARLEFDRAALRMIRAAERSFEQPGDAPAVRDFYRATGALRRARERLDKLDLAPELAALAQATQAQRFFAAMRLREASSTLGGLAARAQLDPTVAEHGRRAFERALAGLLRELPAASEKEALEAGLSEAYRGLGRARGQFEQLPAGATAAALESAREGLAESYRQLDALHRRVIAEHLPQVAGAYQAGLDAQAQLALARYRALAAEVLTTRESWASLPLTEPLPTATLEPALRAIERLELRFHDALGEVLAPLRRQLQESELTLAANRLQALYQARTESPLAGDAVLAELGAAENRFLRAEHRLGQVSEHRPRFEAQIDRRLRAALDELVHQPTAGPALAGAHEQFHSVLARFASAVASHQRFHHALPELPPLLAERGFRSLLRSFERLEEAHSAALQGSARVHPSTQLAVFALDPRALAARAADQLWADRAALGGFSIGYIREQLLARGAHRFDRAIPDPVAYVEQVARRARDLAERTRIRLERRSSGLGSLALLALPAELRLAAHAAGLLTGKATPLGIASFTVSLAQLTWHYLERAGRDSEERGR